MLISVKYTPAAWLVDENTANMVPEFRDLLADSNFGAKALAFVALTKDPTSFLSSIYEEEDTRMQQAFTSVFEKGDAKKYCKLKIVAAALGKYEDICDMPSIKMRQEYRESVRAANRFIYEKRDSLDMDSFGAYITALAKLPEQIERHDEMTKADLEDIELAKKVVRGGRELTYLEKNRNTKRKKG